jgi:AIR synthase-related protein
MTLAALVDHLRGTLGVRHKLDIQPVHDLLRGVGHPAVAIGDDCAAIPDGDGYLLLAIEGLLASFVEKEPWFAGYCAVMVNVSDIYAMGGRPIAIVDAVWTNGADRAGPIWDGMTTAAAKYVVPIVGGHTNSRSPSGDHLAAAILGRASTLLTSFDTRPDDVLIAAIDLRGEWFGPYPYWNASTTAGGARLRGDLELLPRLAEEGLCRAAKDISMGGIVGTAVMLAECSGVGFSMDLDAIPKPAGATLEKWLTAFPSFGFLLAVDPAHADAIVARFNDRGITAAAIGTCTADGLCVLRDDAGAEATFWNLNDEAFIGLGASAAARGGG